MYRIFFVIKAPIDYCMKRWQRKNEPTDKILRYNVDQILFDDFKANCILILEKKTNYWFALLIYKRGEK